MFHRKYFFIIIFAAVSIIPASSYSSPESITDTRVENLVNALSQNDNENKKFYIGYFSGVQDATMNIGLHFKIWCFPTPMPSRKEFLNQYLKDYIKYSEKEGYEKAQILEIDQMLFMSWGKRYLCPGAPVQKP